MGSLDSPSSGSGWCLQRFTLCLLVFSSLFSEAVRFRGKTGWQKSRRGKGGIDAFVLSSLPDLSPFWRERRLHEDRCRREETETGHTVSPFPLLTTATSLGDTTSADRKVQEQDKQERGQKRGSGGGEGVGKALTELVGGSGLAGESSDPSFSEFDVLRAVQLAAFSFETYKEPAQVGVWVRSASGTNLKLISSDVIRSSFQGVVLVTVIEARGLPLETSFVEAALTGREPDAFTVVSVTDIKGTSGSAERTETARGTRTPKWGETKSLYVKGADEDQEGAVLGLEVINNNFFGDNEVIGRAALPLQWGTEGNGVEEDTGGGWHWEGWLPLRRCAETEAGAGGKGKEEEEECEVEETCGEIHIALRLIPFETSEEEDAEGEGDGDRETGREGGEERHKHTERGRYEESLEREKEEEDEEDLKASRLEEMGARLEEASMRGSHAHAREGGEEGEMPPLPPDTLGSFGYLSDWNGLAETLFGFVPWASREFECVCFVDNAETSTQVSFWRNVKSREIVVAFRGTEMTEWRDFVTDVAILQDPFELFRPPDVLGGWEGEGEEKEGERGEKGGLDHVSEEAGLLEKCRDREVVGEDQDGDGDGVSVETVFGELKGPAASASFSPISWLMPDASVKPMEKEEEEEGERKKTDVGEALSAFLLGVGVTQNKKEGGEASPTAAEINQKRNTDSANLFQLPSPKAALRQFFSSNTEDSPPQSASESDRQDLKGEGGQVKKEEKQGKESKLKNDLADNALSWFLVSSDLRSLLSSKKQGTKTEAETASTKEEGEVEDRDESPRASLFEAPRSMFAKFQRSLSFRKIKTESAVLSFVREKMSPDSSENSDRLKKEEEGKGEDVLPTALAVFEGIAQTVMQDVVMEEQEEKGQTQGEKEKDVMEKAAEALSSLKFPQSWDEKEKEEETKVEKRKPMETFKLLEIAEQLGSQIAKRDLKEPRVHAGFQRAYLSVREVVNEIIRQLTPTKAGERPWRVLVTGHSLGGALATLCSLDLQLHSHRRAVWEKAHGEGEKGKGKGAPASPSPFSVSMYTFGSPRVGNGRFADLYNRNVWDAFKVVNNQDVVARLPRGASAWLLDYEHVGRTVVLGYRGQTSIFVEGEPEFKRKCRREHLLRGVRKRREQRRKEDERKKRLEASAESEKEKEERKGVSTDLQEKVKGRTNAGGSEWDLSEFLISAARSFERLQQQRQESESASDGALKGKETSAGSLEETERLLSDTLRVLLEKAGYSPERAEKEASSRVREVKGRVMSAQGGLGFVQTSVVEALGSLASEGRLGSLPVGFLLSGESEKVPSGELPVLEKETESSSVWELQFQNMTLPPLPFLSSGVLNGGNGTIGKGDGASSFCMGEKANSSTEGGLSFSSALALLNAQLTVTEEDRQQSEEEEWEDEEEWDPSENPLDEKTPWVRDENGTIFFVSSKAVELPTLSEKFIEAELKLMRALAAGEALSHHFEDSYFDALQAAFEDLAEELAKEADREGLEDLQDEEFDNGSGPRGRKSSETV